ncbi:hypothetical protein OVA29_03565 [Exiguobacterium sp. SL14]|nr:hypothetical protein [Exiguobacterium sp. SL14]MCY1690009.1 hypothetical protein [Exiguobacterium sp. SL14]
MMERIMHPKPEEHQPNGRNNSNQNQQSTAQLRVKRQSMPLKN